VLADGGIRRGEDPGNHAPVLPVHLPQTTLLQVPDRVAASRTRRGRCGSGARAARRRSHENDRFGVGVLSQVPPGQHECVLEVGALHPLRIESDELLG